jgi:proteasome lid subunit RPN8/RPN11
MGVPEKPRLVIPERVRRALVRQARQERPRECCGFLVGAAARAQFAVPMRNIAEGRSLYRIDPAAHIDLRRVLRQFTPPLEIIGVYHSHPAGDAVPSPTDLSEAMYSNWFYVIVGFGRGPRVRAFRISKRRAKEVVICPE